MIQDYITTMILDDRSMYTICSYIAIVHVHVYKCMTDRMPFDFFVHINIHATIVAIFNSNARTHNTISNLDTSVRTKKCIRYS